MFAEQANPLKVQGLGLANEQTGYENTLKKVESETKAALKDDDIASKRAKMLADMDDNKLRQLQTRAEWEMMQDDPKLRDSGMRKLMASKAEWDRRNKQKDELEKIAAQGQNSKDVANIHAGATLGAARIGADSRQAVAKAKSGAGSDIDALLNTGKVPPDKAAIAYYNRAMSAESEEERQALLGKAQVAERLAMNLRAATNQNKIDPGAATGLPTIQVPSAIPQGAAPAAPQAQTPKPPSFSEVQKMYPGRSEAQLREAYKKKYGVNP
jgi:hypothetical protein